MLAAESEVMYLTLLSIKNFFRTSLILAATAAAVWDPSNSSQHLNINARLLAKNYGYKTYNLKDCLFLVIALNACDVTPIKLWLEHLVLHKSVVIVIWRQFWRHTFMCFNAFSAVVPMMSVTFLEDGTLTWRKDNSTWGLTCFNTSRNSAPSTKVTGRSLTPIQ